MLIRIGCDRGEGRGNGSQELVAALRKSMGDFFVFLVFCCEDSNEAGLQQRSTVSTCAGPASVFWKLV